MSMDRLNNINIVAEELLASPIRVKAELALPPAAEAFVFESRERIKQILDHRNHRLLMVVGPCSIHNVESGLEYARRLKRLSDDLQDTMLLVMRVYFEKPRTSVGWKGLINDPHLDDSFRIEEGLRVARRFLLQLTELRLPAGTETLDPIVPQYIGDLISWTAIGARTSESQTHREIASGLSSPVGFKNGTDGNIDLAVNAIRSAQNPHHFLGITQDGCSAVFRTAGNRHAHIVLRGGTKPNYDRASIAYCQEKLLEAGLPASILIDCSHGNSNRNPNQQPRVFEEGVRQIMAGNRSVIGFMMESNLEPGSQAIPADLSTLHPGISVTDDCMGWDATERVLRAEHEKLKAVLPRRFS